MNGKDMNGNSGISWQQATDDELVRAHLMCGRRDDELKEQLRRLKAVEEGIEREMLARMNRRQQDGFRTGAATVSRTKVNTISCAAEGWPKFYRWLLAEAVRLEKARADPTQVFAYLHRRVTKEAVESYMAANDGRVPPAINVMPAYGVSVRRRSESARTRAAA
ncbi:hypothetical protein P3T23_004507 [Paraburkholderia sp. GAS448]|uniref:hypothetical protein n=1 Tax=Paraburkholderia sp. GAS448 TaxID=3035136 RepID=UPI003D2029E2